MCCRSNGTSLSFEETNTTGFKQAVLPHPDVIVCDMMMPETNGIMFRLLVKEEGTTRGIPLIFFSSGNVPFALLQDLKDKGDVYLHNPFSHEELLVAIDWCLNKVGKKTSLALVEF